MMKLIVGLGNPGSNYARNRHNVGFMAIDRIHDRWNGGPWRRKFQSEVAEATVHGERVMFLKPLTYMNESGRAVSEASRFYKVSLADIVVAHDEIDLPPGKFRMKTGGGTGGHNGLKSITAHMRDGYRRLRIGVGHPGRKEMVPGYVLHDFAGADDSWLDPLLSAFAEEAAFLARGEDASFASKVHLRLAPPSGRGNSAGATAPNGTRPAAGASSPGQPAVKENKPGARPFAVLAQLLRK
ncbi:MAG: aminoacyl-tRNA hydrolase [Pseudomonadota bacterium]